MIRIMRVENLLIAVVIVVECTSLALTIPSKQPLVESEYGKIIGKTRYFPDEHADIKYVNTFLGIPYASPPVHNLRFKPPQPPAAWRPATYEATSFRNVCAQFNHSYFENSFRVVWPDFTWEKDSSEDCLYLNIFAPGANATNTSQLYPVIVFIHGGSYVFGSIVRPTTPGEVLPRRGVVLVTIQYRLGPFGFLTTGDEEARGNWGMLDQVQALKWIQGNIKAFGGDPNRVTILGVSSGGASVGLHLLSPLSEGLFHQAIAESGVEFSPFAFRTVEEAVEKTKTAAKKLDCDGANHKDMMVCLREKETNDIVKSYGWHHVGPVIDNHFINDTPINLRRSGHFKPVPLIAGFNSNEGSHNLPSEYKPPREITSAVFRESIEAFVKNALSHDNNITASLIADAIEFQYTPWGETLNSSTLRQKLVDLQSDYYVAAPTVDVLGIHSQKAPAYMFEFSHRSKRNTAELWRGVQHGDNTPYDFGAPFLNITSLDFTEEDKKVSSLIMSLYANFARDGVPTPSPVHGVTWREFKATDRSYLVIQAAPEMKVNFKPHRMAFWNNYYPRVLNFSKNLASSEKCRPTKEINNEAMEQTLNPGFLALLMAFTLFLWPAVFV